MKIWIKARKIFPNSLKEMNICRNIINIPIDIALVFEMSVEFLKTFVWFNVETHFCWWSYWILLDTNWNGACVVSAKIAERKRPETERAPRLSRVGLSKYCTCALQTCIIFSFKTLKSIGIILTIFKLQLYITQRNSCLLFTAFIYLFSLLVCFNSVMQPNIHHLSVSCV